MVAYLEAGTLASSAGLGFTAEPGFEACELRDKGADGLEVSAESSSEVETLGR